MIKNSLIIIGSTLPYDFPADYIKQTALVLSKKNKVIIFLWGNALSIKELISRNKKIKIIEKKDNIILFTPIHFIPFRRFEIIRQINLFINSLLLKIFINFIKFRNPVFSKRIIWIFNQEFYNWPKTMGKNYLSLYDCVEYPSSLDKKTEKDIRYKENELIKNAGLFFVDSPTLQKVHKKYNSIIVPQGFDIETFKKYKNYIPKIKLPKGKPVIGYIGSINYRLDYPLLVNLAQNNPQWNFVFVGQKQFYKTEDKYINTQYWQNKLFKIKNVFYIPNQPRKNLSYIIKMFDVCLIPYNIKIKFNLYSRAMKLYEYFYMKKPVISVPILESYRLRKTGIILVKNNQQLDIAIQTILSSNWQEKFAKYQKQLFCKNSWNNKIKTISQILNRYD